MAFLSTRALAGALLLGSAFAAVSACGGTPAETLDPATAAAKAFCSYSTHCNTGLFTSGGLANEAECVTVTSANLAHALALPGVGNLAATVAACGAALDATSCNFDEIAACNGPQTGVLPTGSPCEFGDQCASRICSFDAAKACGVCGAPSKGAVGTACDASNPCARHAACEGGVCRAAVTGTACSVDSECPIGDRCDGATCAPHLKLGDACAPAHDACASRLVCEPTSRTCAPEGAVGVSCATPADCDPNRGAYCDAVSHRCAAVKSVFVAVGDACGTVDRSSPGTVAVCPTDSFCEGTPAAPLNLNCKQRGAVGAACGTSTATSCGSGLRCIGDTCAAPTSCTSGA